MTDYLGWRVVAPRLDHVDIVRYSGNLPSLRRKQKERQCDDDQPLSESKIQEGGLEAGILDHRLDRRDRQCRTGAESCCGDAGGEAALVGKPFQRVADTGAIHAAGANARDDHAEIEAIQGRRFGVDRPADTAKNPAISTTRRGPYLS